MAKRGPVLAWARPQWAVDADWRVFRARVHPFLLQVAVRPGRLNAWQVFVVAGGAMEEVGQGESADGCEGAQLAAEDHVRGLVSAMVKALDGASDPFDPWNHAGHTPGEKREMVDLTSPQVREAMHRPMEVDRARIATPAGLPGETLVGQFAISQREHLLRQFLDVLEGKGLIDGPRQADADA